LTAVGGRGLPASTTDVRSSGVPGTMWADKSGSQDGTVREIPPAWSITLPPVILLSALIDRAAALVTG
jgi:phosphate/sulfate permease